MLITPVSSPVVPGTSSSAPSVATAAAPTGHSPVSTLTPAPTPSRGYIQKISDFFVSIVNSIRDGLAKIPFVGRLFERTPALPPALTGGAALPLAPSGALPPAPIVAAPGAALPAPDLTDADNVRTIQTMFTETSIVAPDATVFEGIVTLVSTDIKNSDAKLQAFQTIVKSGNATAEMMRQIFTALPVALQNEYKGQIYASNGYTDEIDGMIDERVAGDLGGFIVKTAINGPLARQAIDASNRKQSCCIKHSSCNCVV